jgi:ZIP family zinc transporter
VNNFLQVMVLALLPAVGNFVGGLIAEVAVISRHRLGIALHAAAGIILAVVAVELMPRALNGEPAWAVVAAFVAGGGFFVLIDSLIDIAAARRGESGHGNSRPWTIYFAVAIDLFTDGVIIGTSSTISIGLALLLALGQVSADIPEGFATMASFKSQGFPRSRRLLIGASFMLPVLLGATIGYWIVRGQPEIYKLSLLAFAAGVLVTGVVEEIVPEAHQEGEARVAALALVGGFALFTLLSVYFG